MSVIIRIMITVIINPQLMKLSVIISYVVNKYIRPYAILNNTIHMNVNTKNNFILEYLIASPPLTPDFN
jgi:hypothetical protein